MNRIKKFFRIFGPGVITGAADDDPSGIATYSQTGAQFGYGQLWTAVFMLPLLVSVQEACARIGAMAAAAQLILPINFVILTLYFTVTILILEIFVSYRIYANHLKWLTLSLIAYPITVFMVKEPWWEILKATFIPYIEFNFQFFYIIMGVLGTIISPYLFFWQASQVVEESRDRMLSSPGCKPHIDRQLIKRLRIDNFVGMLFSEIIAWCIMVVTATVLHTNGITDIKTSADAARALEPFVQTFPYSGYLPKVIFSFGIIGLGFLSVPILAGASAYALSEAFNWKDGLNLKLRKAHGFYGVITISTLIGLMINFVGINPIKALIYAAVLNGVVAVPLIGLIALISSNKKIMGEYNRACLQFIPDAYVPRLVPVSSTQVKNVVSSTHFNLCRK